MAKKKPKAVMLPNDDPDAERLLLGPAIRIPGRHKGNIPAKVIRAAVKKVAEERRRRKAEEAAQVARAVEAGK